MPFCMIYTIIVHSLSSLFTNRAAQRSLEREYCFQ